jgi:hypothetical protein
MVAIIRSQQSNTVEQAVNPVAVRASQTALGGLGEGLNQVGGMFDNFQEEIDTADAKAADSAYSDLIRSELYDDQTGFMYAQGGDAVNRRNDVATRIEDAQTRILGDLSPSARRAASSAMGARYQRALQNVDVYTAGQRQGYMNDASNARIISTVQDAIYNPDQIAQSLITVNQEITDMAESGGWPTEKTDLARRDAETEIHSGIIGRLETAAPDAALQYLRDNRESMAGDEVARLEGILVPRVREMAGRNIGRTLAMGGAQLSLGTRAVNPAGNGVTNISLDFNASANGGARGTEVIIPDNASPQIRQAAEGFNQAMVDFAAKHGIEHPNRGVRTTSENGRGVSNTVHVEPFFNDNVALQRAIEADFEAFSQIYDDAFGGLDGVRIIPPHGVGDDRGAVSEVFDTETAFGQRVIRSLMDGRSNATNDILAIRQIADMKNPEQRAAAMNEFEFQRGVRDMEGESVRQGIETAAFQMIEGGGSIEDLPLEMRQGLGADAMSSMRTYQNSVASGRSIQTDDTTYVDLADMMANNPERFMSADPMEWRSRLDDGDFEYFVKQRSDMIAGTRPAAGETGSPPISALRTAASTALEAAGISDDADKSAAFERELLQWATQNPALARDPMQLNTRVNQMLVPIVIDPTGMRNKQSGALYTMDYDGAAIDPEDDVTPGMLRDGSLKINGVTVTNDMIELFANGFNDRFQRAPDVRELVEGLTASGLYE